MFLQAVYILFFLLGFITAANILAICFHPSKSHHFLGETLLKELARRGHNVTMASAFHSKEPFPNYTDIQLNGIYEYHLSRENDFMEMNKGNALTAVPFLVEWTETQTEMTLNHTEMTKLLQSGTKFDVVIIDWFLNYAHVVFGHLFNAPIIGLVSHGTSEFASWFMNSPTPLSYVPKSLLPFTSNMTFIQRAINTVFEFVTLLKQNEVIKVHENLIKKYFNNTPSYDKMRESVALLLSNGHYSFEYPRPLVPNIVLIGGFHVQVPKKLPKDLQKFLDDAENGVIYFSLGTNMKSSLLPKEKQQAILNAFSRLPYKILWKWENDDLLEKPSNVLIRPWFPQISLLAHPKLRLFISHGGLLSTIEAVHFGKPVLGIPIFGDQFRNIFNLVNSGCSLHLSVEELNEDSLTIVINKLLNNSKYADNAKKQSALLHDQPMKPMDLAVYWVEHVIRHKGAPHLQNFGFFLAWYQYFLLDVLALFLGIFIILVIVSHCVIKKTRNVLKKIFAKHKSE